MFTCIVFGIDFMTSRALSYCISGLFSYIYSLHNLNLLAVHPLMRFVAAFHSKLKSTRRTIYIPFSFFPNNERIFTPWGWAADKALSLLQDELVEFMEGFVRHIRF